MVLRHDRVARLLYLQFPVHFMAKAQLHAEANYMFTAIIATFKFPPVAASKTGKLVLGTLTFSERLQAL